jgi:selT/selW/selH-like putative selenoprotein
MLRLSLLRLSVLRHPGVAACVDSSVAALGQRSEQQASTASSAAAQPALRAAPGPWFTSNRWFSQCSCPGLGGPPPDRLFIEYDPDDLEKFIALADGIEEELPGVIVEGNVSGDGRPTSFEVTIPDGTVVFSKLEQGRLPTVDELVASFTVEQN